MAIASALGCEPTPAPSPIQRVTLTLAEQAEELRTSSEAIGAGAATIESLARDGERIAPDLSGAYWQPIADEAREIDRLRNNQGVLVHALIKLNDAIQREREDADRAIAQRDARIEALEDDLETLRADYERLKSEQGNAAYVRLILWGGLLIAASIAAGIGLGAIKLAVMGASAGVAMIAFGRFMIQYGWLMDVVMVLLFLGIVGYIVYQGWRHRHAFGQVVNNVETVVKPMLADASKALRRTVPAEQVVETPDATDLKQQLRQQLKASQDDVTKAVVREAKGSAK